MSVLRWRPRAEPWQPPDDDEQITYAWRALREGKANDAQQKDLWNWLMYATGAGDGYADMSFRPGPDGDRTTIFAEGKRFIGLQILKHLHPAKTPKPKNQSSGGRGNGSRLGHLGAKAAHPDLWDAGPSKLKEHLERLSEGKRGK